MSVLDYDRLERLAEAHHDEFVDAGPFPHIVLDDFLPPDIAEALLKDFSETHKGWKHYHHYNERKSAITQLGAMPPNTQRVFEALQSQQTIDFLTRLTGIEGLLSDPDLEGAGMHHTLPGGHLNIHTDFLTHPKKRSLRREINLLIYLNKDWEESYNGNLELWDKGMTRCIHSVLPAFNRCVIFNTIPGSYHGHPRKLSCPPSVSRKHILLYYYRDEGRPLALAPTDYRPLPGDSILERTLVAADRALLRIYTALKSRTKLSDRAMSRILKHL